MLLSVLASHGIGVLALKRVSVMAELRLDLSKIDRDLEAQYDDQELQDDEECVEDIDPLMDSLSPDDLLSPMDKLYKYYQSDDVGERDIALRMIPDALQSVSSFSDLELLLNVVFALAIDYEPCIRINVLANISPLLDKNLSLQDHGAESVHDIEEKLFGIPVKMLVDINLQVRRASQNCIVNLLEDERGNKDNLLSQLCPIITRCLGRDENYDLRMDTVLMLGRIAAILGRELIVDNFVPLLPSLALDTMFHVRKAYVMSCRELCPVLGEEDSEQHLLPLFFKLCKDEVWGVRKACADVFTDVSASCNLGTRHDKLTPVYLSLLHDDSRWVRKAAFQSLGAFISTFYIPGLSPELDNSLPPLTDSFLESAQLSSSTGQSTSDPSIETRHTDSEFMSSSTVSAVEAKPNPVNEGSPEPEVEFVASEILRTSSEESLEKSLQEMTVEDLEQPENSPFIKGHDLSTGESEENDILDSAIKRIDVQPPLTLDEPLVAHPPSLKSLKLDGSEESSNKTVEDVSNTPHRANNNSSATTEGAEVKHSRLNELLMEDNARIRSSSEGSSFRSFFDPVAHSEGGKKRRWSMDKNNATSQVRVFIHSASGKVTEQDMSVVDADPLTPETPKNFDLSSNATISHSVAMDITLDGVESLPSDPNLVADPLGQEVVPDELLESYLSMTEQIKAQVVDTDLPYYCAYSLPGVALTLGQEHWPLLKPTFSMLASDMQWRIRRVLSFSLHELAKVVGEERMCSDILPVFEEYCTKDIDDVKIGALSHLAEFFELLPSVLQDRHLPGVLNGLQDVENEKNWRYRNLLAEQLVLLCDLFDCQYLEQHVYPVALILAEDRVAEVRATATLVLGVILQKLSEMDVNKCRTILRQLKSYGSNEKWLFRLMYVKQCELFLLDGRISCELFASECLPILLQLARDKVPNVRITVAKLLKESVLNIDYFQTENRETFSLEELQITLECLQHDQDRDVKFFAGGEVSDTRRLMKLPVQWYAQRQRSESFQSHNSNDQYQDALEDQSHPPHNDPHPPDSEPRPLSLTMAGVLVNSLKKSPTNEQAGLDSAITAESAALDSVTVTTSSGTIADSRISQNTPKSTQESITKDNNTGNISPPQDTNTLETQDTTPEPQDTTPEPLDTTLEPTIESQDTTLETQDTTVESQDTTTEPTPETRDTILPTSLLNSVGPQNTQECTSQKISDAEYGSRDNADVSAITMNNDKNCSIDESLEDRREMSTQDSSEVTTATGDNA